MRSRVAMVMVGLSLGVVVACLAYGQATDRSPEAVIVSIASPTPPAATMVATPAEERRVIVPIRGVPGPLAVVALRPGPNEFDYAGPPLSLTTFLAPFAGKYEAAVVRAPSGVETTFLTAHDSEGYIVESGSHISLTLTAR